VGDSFAGITVPEGEPGELRSAGQTFAGISGALQGVSSELGALPGMLSAWQGPASVNYAGSVLTNGSALDAGTEALRSASLAANRYAEELEQAQDDARAAIRDARIAQKRIDQAEVDIDSAQGRAGVARVNLAVASGRVLATGLTGLPSPDALADQSAAERAIGEAEADAGRARRELAQAQEDLKLAQQRGRRAEQDARDAARTVAGAFGTAGAGSPAVALFGSPGSPVAGGGGLAGIPPFVPLQQLGRGGSRSPFAPGSPFGPLTAPLAGAPGSNLLHRVLAGTGYANNIWGGTGKGTIRRAKELDELLSTSKNPATRADAGRQLLRAGGLANNPVIKAGARHAPVVGPVLDVAADRAEGRSWLESLGHSATKLGGGLLGGAAGGWACATETVATAGAGVVACPTLVTGGATLGSEGAGAGYDKLFPRDAPAKPETGPAPIPPLVPVETLRSDVPPLMDQTELLLKTSPPLRPVAELRP